MTERIEYLKGLSRLIVAVIVVGFDIIIGIAFLGFLVKHMYKLVMQ